jgi:hypothetical protein
MTKRDKLWCDFCGKTLDRGLICAGPRANICLACSQEAAKIIREKLIAVSVKESLKK